MFGFLGSPCRSCSPQDTHSTYRSFFCGLSGALRDDYTPAARFLVNRDSTFLSLLTASLNPIPPVISHRTCCNPISVPKPLFTDGLHARFAAAVTVCGLSAKLDDDRSDETGLHKNAARVLGRAVSPMTDRAISFLNSIRFPTADVVAMMEEQSAIEASKPDLLTAASPTANAYGTIFSQAARLANAPNQQTRLQSLGQNLGRLIYWQDAHQDRTEDAKRGRFNPLEKADKGEFQHHFTTALTDFHQVGTLAGSFQETIRDILSSTFTRHRPLIATHTLPVEQQERLASLQLEEAKKSKKEKDRCQDCCDNLFCCQIGGEGICCLGCESLSCCS